MFSAKWARVLLIAGLLAMIVGALDPIEGSFVILPGVVLAAVAAWAYHSSQRAVLTVAAILVALGVAALVGLTAWGGVGGTSGHSTWWLLLALPYVVGWFVGLFSAVKVLREKVG